jgi:hypothetical protein
MASHFGVTSYMLTRMDDLVRKRRAALVRFMEANGLKASSWALAAGLSKNILLNYVNERSDSLSQSTWEKLAAERGMTAPQLLAAVEAHQDRAGSRVDGDLPSEAPEGDRAQLDSEAFALFDAAPPEVQEALLTLLRAAVGDASTSGRAARKKARS